MKSERRHELETNYLADWLGKHMTEYAPYAKSVVGVLIVGLTLLVLFRYMSAQKVKKNQDAWQDYFAGVTDFYESGDVEELEAIAKSEAGTPAGAWAWQSAGDALLFEGATSLYVDREEAKEKLAAAHDAYKKSLEGADGDMLKQRALLGLAQVSEGLNQLDQAKEYYQKVVDQWPEKALGHLASERLNLLNADSTQAFCSWFAKQEPLDRTSTGSASGVGTAASIHSDLPDVPGLSLPSLEDLQLDRKSLTAPENTAVEVQPTDEETAEDAAGSDVSTDDAATDDAATDDAAPDGAATDDAAPDDAATEDAAPDDAAPDDAATDDAATDDAATDDAAPDDAATDDAAPEDAAPDGAATDDAGTDDAATDDAGTDDAATDDAGTTDGEASADASPADDAEATDKSAGESTEEVADTPAK